MKRLSFSLVHEFKTPHITRRTWKLWFQSMCGIVIVSCWCCAYGTAEDAPVNASSATSPTVSTTVSTTVSPEPSVEALPQPAVQSIIQTANPSPTQIPEPPPVQLLVPSLSQVIDESPHDVVVRDSVQAYAEQLLAIPDRSMGTSGSLHAIEIIEKHLVDAGIRCVRVPTTVSIPVVREAWLQVGDRRVAMTPLTPNRVATAGTGGNAITAPIVYVGNGSPAELDHKNVGGAIAVMNAEGGAHWRACAEAGALALIITNIEQLDMASVTALGSDASIPFPRFYADVHGIADGTVVTIQSEVAWEASSAWSLVGIIPGRSRAQEAVLLTSGYEANGPIVGHRPGATRAWNAAALVDIAKQCAKHVPERSTVFIFNGGRAEMFRGLRHIVAALTVDREPDALDRIANQVPIDSMALHRLDALSVIFSASTFDETCNQVEPQERSATRGILYSMLAHEASVQADRAHDQVDVVRLALAPRKRVGIDPGRIAEMEKRLAEVTPIARAWRLFQQHLDRRSIPDATEQSMLADIIPLVRQDVARAQHGARLKMRDSQGLAAARMLLDQSKPVHLLALDLSAGGRRFCTVTSGWYVTWKMDQTWMHRGVARLANALRLSTFETAADSIPGDRTAFWTDNYVHESGVAGLYLPAVTLSTTDDARLRLGSPADTAGNFDHDIFMRQFDDVAKLVRAWIDSPELSTHRTETIALTNATVRAEVRATGTTSGRRPAPFAQVCVDYRRQSVWQGDVRPHETWWCDQVGEVVVPFLPKMVPGFEDGAGLSLKVYDYDDHGTIVAVPASGGIQATSGDLRLRLDGQLRDVLAVLVPAVPSVVYRAIDPRLMQPLESFGVLAATRQAQPDNVHIEVDDGDAVLWTAADQSVMVTATQGRGAHRLLLLGDTLSHGAFAGHPTGLQSRMTARDVAHDVWQLNEQRLAALRHSGVEAEALAMLHAEAERHLRATDTAMEQGQRARAEGEALSAWAYASRVYPGVLAAGNDVVHGLMILLLLALPCAWMLERLVLAGSTIVRRVLGFAAIFVALFIGLFVLHPAASLAATPMIVLLAFLIIVMSAWVMAVLHVRFEQEMTLLRQNELSGHQADVTRLGALVATVELGASNMRRRPVRTILTVTTVVLMTFTLLTFASFNPSQDVRRVRLDTPASFDGILVRRNGWASMNQQAEEQLTVRWGKDFQIFPLRWLMPNAGSRHLPVSGPSGTSRILGLIGVDAADPTGLDRGLVRGSGSDAPRGLGEVPADGRDWIFLPPEVLRRCGIEPGQVMMWRGIECRAGTTDARALSMAMQLGGESPTPIAEEALAGDGSARIDHLNLASSDGAPRVESMSFAHQDVSAVAVVRTSLARRLGAELSAISLVPRHVGIDLDAVPTDMAHQLAMTLRVGRQGETWLYTGVGRLSASGLGAAFVPLVLGGLIVFATMLGAVAERGREIFTYASLGLAPVHIATLFLVEASIYAVLGALGGWLFAQLVVLAFSGAAYIGLVNAVPDLNYSSTTALATIFLVMIAVLLSALYPALLAARAANPGGKRPALPVPSGDHWVVAFPVTVPIRDVRGILAFIADWMVTAGESGNQSFTAGEVALGETEEEDHEQREPRLQAKVWLAPFDLGLSQTISVEVEIIDLPGSRGLSVILERKSGGHSDWRRANVAFLKEMRRQVLIWRTLSPELMDIFRARGGDVDAVKRVAARKPI